MDGEATPPSPAPAAGDSVSRVLEDDDLLVEILLRVGRPGGLVRAAAACRRWLGLASEPAFLRRFRDLHPPVLLGFYLDDGSVHAGPRFVPMLEGLPEFALEETGGGGMWRYILDCRNGRVLTLRRDGDGLAYEVHRPLCPGIGVAALPPPPSSRGYSEIFFREGTDGPSYFHMSMASARLLQVHMLGDGVWRKHLPPPRLQAKHVLAGGEIYMAAPLGGIIVLDLTTSSFSVIQLPQGMEYSSLDTMLSRADDASGVYLIHFKELQLRVWHHDGDAWSLVDTICLRGLLANMTVSGCAAHDYHLLLRLRRVGDNAEFAFFEMCRYVLYLDIKRRTMRKVYVMKETVCHIDPLMMIWPPTFPALKDDPARSTPASWIGGLLPWRLRRTIRGLASFLWSIAVTAGWSLWNG